MPASPAWACSLSIFILSNPLAAQVTPDGSTATTVAPGSGGRVRINIAPSNPSGTSLNRYQQFNSAKPGLEFQNAGVGARTIVNQVTGTTPSRLEGQIEVLGPRANVIVANPNGIAVNGAEFINTGGLALTTGVLGTRSHPVAPGFNNDNVVATVTDGKITVEEGGLTGAFSYLELLAKEIEIRGAVVNAEPSATSRTRITAGGSETEFDSLAVPGNSAGPWATVTSQGKSEPGRTLVTVTRSGSISANNIQVSVTDKGAGVRWAGDGLAKVGDFVLTATGEVVIPGGRITAAQRVRIEAPSTAERLPKITASEGEGRPHEISGDAGVVLRADSLELVNGRITSAQGNVDMGLAGEAATGPTLIQDTTIQSGSDWTVSASGQQINISRSLATVGNNAVLTSKALSIDNSVIQADRWRSSTNSITELVATQLTANNDVTITASGFVAMAGGNKKKGYAPTNVAALGGPLKVITGKGGIKVLGSILQGNEEDGRNGVILKTSGKLKARSLSADALAIISANTGNLSIDSSDDIFNESGRFLAAGDVFLHTSGDIWNRTLTTRDFGSVDWEHRRVDQPWHAPWRKQRRYTSADFGQMSIAGGLAYVTAGGSIDVEADSLMNLGGQFNANNGSILADVDWVYAEALRTGRMRYDTSRHWWIRKNASGFSDVAIQGGSFSAGADVDFDTGHGVQLLGGTILALENVAITGDQVSGEALPVYQYYVGHQGMRELWSGKRRVMLSPHSGGSIISTQGEIRLDTQEEVRLQSGVLEAPLGIHASEGWKVTPQPGTAKPFGDTHFGFLGSLLD